MLGGVGSLLAGGGGCDGGVGSLLGIGYSGTPLGLEGGGVASVGYVAVVCCDVARGVV